jgi:hypothetical protein
VGHLEAVEHPAQDDARILLIGGPRYDSRRDRRAGAPVTAGNRRGAISGIQNRSGRRRSGQG